MSMVKFMKGSALGALAVAMALTALPAEASAQGRGGDHAERQDNRGQARQNMRQQSPQVRPQERAQPRVDRRPAAMRDDRRAQARPNDGERNWSRTQDRRSSDWNRSNNRSATGQERNGQEWNRSDNRSTTGQERSGRDWNRSDRRQGWNDERARDKDREQARDRARDRDDRNWTRNGSYAGDRNRSYRDTNRDDRWRDRDGKRDYHDDRRRDNDRRARYHDGRGWHDYDRWDRDHWRHNNRYDWRGYRNHNRDIYRIGRYYSPYRDYRYSRLNIGYNLGSMFYSNRYWINDPWRYRLPDVYGPYRWVRYFDDVLLVDIYSGEVVDVINDFFW